MFVTILLILLCAPFLWWFFILLKFKSLKKVPGPKGLPIIGNIIDIGDSPQEFLTNISKFNNKYGTTFRIDIINQVRVFITKPKLVEQLLTSQIHLTKSNAYDLLKPWLGSGLVLSTGHKWKTRRKMITPSFHFQILDQFIEVFNSAGDILVKKLTEEVDSASFDIYPYINRYTLDVICETAMGVKIGVQEGGNPAYVNAIRNYLDIFISRAYSWRKFDFLFRFSSLFPEYKNSLKILHSFTNNIIENRRRTHGKSQEFKERDDGIKRRVALLDMLLASESNSTLSNEDLREEIETFMFAGHDTTSTGLSFTLLALAENPTIQDKLYDEIKCLTDDNQNLTMQCLQNAKYLEMVIKESQRVYPSVPAFERALESDLMLGDYKCPRGTIVCVFAYGMHHDASNFPDPEKFDPERFLPENQSQRHTYAYVPFSAGPRNCIGQKFAMLQMKSTIIKILSSFKVLPVPNFKPEIGMAAILNSYNGICLRLEKRC